MQHFKSILHRHSIPIWKHNLVAIIDTILNILDIFPNDKHTANYFHLMI